MTITFTEQEFVKFCDRLREAITTEVVNATAEVRGLSEYMKLQINNKVLLRFGTRQYYKHLPTPWSPDKK